MKKIILHVVTLSLMVAASMPVFAQGQASDEESTEDAAPRIEYPTTGVRFVICTTTNQKLPVPLYVEYKEGYVPLRISARGPSERAVAKGGHILLYKNEPKKDEKGGKKVVEKPFLDVEVPQEVRGEKAICVVMLAGGQAKPVCYFLKEEDFPVGGVYVVNFSPSALDLLYTFTGNFPMEHHRKIAPYRRPENNCLSPNAPNVWTFVMKNNPEVKDIQYVLQKPAEEEGGTPLPLNSSRFTPKKYNSTMTIVVRHPKIEQAFRLVSFVYNNESERMQKEVQQGGDARRGR